MTRPTRRSAPMLALLVAVLGPLGACGGDDGTGPPPPPPTGSVEVTTATTGGSIDADGYMVAVAGGSAQSIGTDAVLTVDDIEVGATSVELTDVAANCTVAGENPSDVTVPIGTDATLNRDGDFEVYVMNADGSGRANLSNAPSSADLVGYARAWR